MTTDDFTDADWPGPIGLAALRELIKPFGLTDRQLNFVVTYSVNGNNAHKAALAAGYSARSARSQASQLLNNPKVQRALAAIAEAQGIRLDILHARLLQVALDADVRDYEPWLLGKESLEDVHKRGVNTKMIKSIRTRTTSRTTKEGTIVTETRELTFHDPLKAISLLLAGLRGSGEAEAAQRGPEIDGTLGEAMMREFREELEKPLVPGIPRQKSLPLSDVKEHTPSDRPIDTSGEAGGEGPTRDH